MGYCFAVPGAEKAWLDGQTLKVSAIMGGHCVIWDAALKGKGGRFAVQGGRHGEEAGGKGR